MPEHNCVRILGTMPGGEVWSVNPRYIGNFGPAVTDYEDLLSWAQSIVALNTGLVLPPDLRAAISTACSVTGVRTEYLGNDGRLIQAAEVTLTTPAAGTGSANKPFQTAIVTSLLTGRPGRSFRGRLYWPALAVSIGTSDLRVGSTARGAIANAAAGFLRAVGQAVPAGQAISLAVVSQTRGTAAAVDQISVGDILDTQRRRRDALQEQRTTVTFPPV